MKRRRPAVALLALAVAAFGALGAWQTWRGQAKQRLLDERATRPATELRGEWFADRQLLLDGQARDGVPGVHVWTPLKLAAGELVIVDRGWAPIPAPALPTPAGEVSVSGEWRPLPQPALRLESGACTPGAFPLTVEYPTRATLQCLLGAPVRDGVLLLDPKAPGGFIREWGSTGFPPARHYAYAAQWFALALVAGIVLVRLVRGPSS